MSLPSARSAYLGWLADALATDGPSSEAVVSGDLVLGYATGYDAAHIAPFVRSLRAVFDGAAALVVDDRPDVQALLAENGFIAITPETLSGWAPHAVVGRFAVFDRLLGQWPDVADVLITDVRDVVFQANPFEPRLNGLTAFVEYENGVLGDHAFNMKYIRAVAGDGLAAEVATRPCLCVGTVMGPREAIRRFCRTLLMLAAVPRSEIGGAFGADQAAANLAIHLGLIEAEIRPNYQRVATLGLTPGESLRFEGGKVINPDGGWSPVVHQHDRHAHLASAVHDLWGAGLEHRQRVTPKTSEQRRRKMKESVLRRLPELR